MNKTIIRVVIGCSILIPLIACSATPSPFIIDTTCEPPCWRNILPGETTEKQLLSILENTAIVNPDSIETIGPWKVFNDVAIFTLRSKEDAEVYILEDKVSLLFFTGKLGFDFVEAVEKFGEPEYILSLKTLGPGPLMGDSNYIFILALYPSKGIEFGFDVRDGTRGSRDEIRPETKIKWLSYYDPAAFDRLSEAGMFSMGLADGQETQILMKPWAGYGVIAEKYPPDDPFP